MTKQKKSSLIKVMIFVFNQTASYYVICYVFSNLHIIILKLFIISLYCSMLQLLYSYLTFCSYAWPLYTCQGKLHSYSLLFQWRVQSAANNVRLPEHSTDFLYEEEPRVCHSRHPSCFLYIQTTAAYKKRKAKYQRHIFWVC